ncbi:MAG: hypothetical protein JNK74_02410 [Candidatus Hydrogenedentes bacterium]|nr:hypothetical protein [Candidatus Hydrogenedentota bacterium]
MIERNLRGPWPWLLLACITLLAALGLTNFLRAMPVEISLDLDTPAEQVSAHWHGGSSSFEQLADAWSPHHYKVRITAPPGGEGGDGGYQLIVMATIDQVNFSDESLWGKASSYFMLHGAERPATLELEGWNLGATPYLSFETDMASEAVEIQSGDEAPQTVSLQSAERGKLKHPLSTDTRRYRYTGEVPLRHVNEVAIAIAGVDQPTVHRLYVNSLIPRLYFAQGRPAKSPTAINTEHWKPAWSGDRFLLPGAFLLGSTFLPTLVILWAGLFCGFLACLLIARLLWTLLRSLWRSSMENRIEGPLPVRAFLAFCLPAFLVWSFFLLVFYPGTMNADSLTQWSEIPDFKFTAIHPPIYALCMWLGTFLWDSPATTALFQILAASIVVGSAFSLLWKAGVPRAVVLALYAVTVLSPRNNTTLISLMKDTPYAIAMLAMVVLLAWYLVQPGRKALLRWGAAGLCLGAACVFRYNGPLVAAVFIPLVFIYFPRQWRAGLLLTAGYFVVTVGVNHGVYSRISIDTENGGAHDLTTCHLAILLDRDVPIRSEQFEFLSKVRDLEDRWAYDPRRVASVVQPFEELYRRAWAKENSQAYMALYKSLVMRNLLNAAMYQVERGEFLYVPWQTEVDMETYFLGISSNDLGLWNTQLFLELPDQLRALLAATAKPGLNWLFWRPALPLYIILIACIVLCIRQRNLAWSIVYLPFVLNTGTIALAAISQACRYQFPLTFAAAFLVGLACLPRPTPPVTETTQD